MKSIAITLLLLTSFMSYSQKLFKAYLKNDIAKIEQLLDNGTDPNIKNKDGVTVLFWAAGDNKLQLIKLLVEKGADVDILNGTGNMTAFFVACGENSYESAKYLLSKGANVNFQVKKAGNQTPIRFASKTGSIKLVQLLLDNGALLEDCPDDCITPLIQAARSNHLELVKFYIGKGAKVNHQARDKETAINQAIKNENSEMAIYLIENGAISMIDEDGKNSLQLAMEYKLTNVINLLNSMQ